MTAPMPETMSPREKVVVKQPCDHCQRMTVVDPAPILAALASSGDHAELARLAEAIGPVEWHPGHLCRDDHPCDCAYVFDDGHAGAIATVHVNDGLSISEGGNDAPEPELAKLHQAFIAAANPATILALIAENAALRAQHEADMAEVALAGQNLQSQRLALTEAERKLAKADRLLERIANDPTWDGPSSARLYLLSKEAERG
ncbi:hypothetical protein ACFPIF_15780 [Brevundimonas faecalis]|uniref:hypothetical protein n=1 Tax=Brevundimonas faecalis TaxID=947378 RepID=UPI00360F5C48